MNDWKIFTGHNDPHNSLLNLPKAPPWRLGGAAIEPRAIPEKMNINKEKSKATAFVPTDEMITAVNAALYLRRPLLLTGKPGTGKSTLISKVAYELMMGPVLRWPITSRSTVRGGVYEYDAVGRLQAGKGQEPPVEKYLTLGPLGTALTAKTWPRALLIDEIDKSDLDFANDLLNVFEEGDYEIPELRRLGRESVFVPDAEGNSVEVLDGRLIGTQFPLIVMTSNGEREFPAPMLRRCIRLALEPPDDKKLAKIVEAHLAEYLSDKRAALDAMIKDFVNKRDEADISTDQLLNAVFLTIAMRNGGERTFQPRELEMLRDTLWQQLSGTGA
jgi:MoxR-like ATPase